MNIFCIPSWYPSTENPIYGIFIKEQMMAISRNHSDINVGVSFWGQGQESHLLWAKDHFQNIAKAWNFRRLKSKKKETSGNYIDYYSPALTWSRSILSGNLKNIIKANVNNLKRFESDFGKADIIHVQASYPGGLIAQSISESFNVPFIITARMSPFPFQEFLTKSGDLNQLIDPPLKKASQIIAISNSLKNKLIARGYPHTTVIHNLVDDDFFKPKNVVVKEGFQFLTVGRAVHQKGLDTLLVALSEIQNTNVTLVIVGSGDEMTNLKRLACSLNIESRIKWVGDQNRLEVRTLIQEAHCLILASRHETFGNVLTEALACGKPIVATMCGGPEDIVNPTNGLLAKVEDPNGLAKKMNHMVDQYHQYDPINIRNDVEKRFSSKVITPQIAKVYQQVIEDHAKPSSGKNG